MYSFFDGNSQQFQLARDKGGFPWWGEGSARAAFWRPLTAIFSGLDYRLWPDSSEWMHVHSLGWFVLVGLAATLVYRKILGTGWAAGLAILLFAVSNVHAVPIVFLANRHIHIALLFGLLSLWSHDRWRTTRQWKWCLSALLFLGLSLSASESGISVLGYLLAYSLFLERDAIRTRIASLIPYVSLITVWRTIYVALGYGISGLDLYTDPLKEPVRFMGNVIERLPIYLLDLLATPPSELYVVLTPLAMHIHWCIACLALVFLGWLFYPLWSGCRIARFWMAGMVFALIPLCAATPSSRTIAIAGFGAAGWIARMVQNRAKGTKDPAALLWQRSTMAILAGIVFIRLLTGGLALSQTADNFLLLQGIVDKISQVGVSDSDLAQKDVILVNPPFPLLTAYLIPIHLLDGKPIPAHFRVLAPGIFPVEIHRSGENTLVVRPTHGYGRPPQWQWKKWNEIQTYVDFINASIRFENMLLKPLATFELGHQISLTGVVIQITQLTEDNHPAEAVFTFDVPLEDPRYIWRQWNESDWRYEPFSLPRIGETVICK